ncbi:hypothetical protein [Paenibacillus gansuensis]|uniref:Amino acid transporter n=1 Tax=Paenibacillus gansuensis TaxID=306542 RepID=A0ABW5PGZ5_9BACL
MDKNKEPLEGKAYHQQEVIPSFNSATDYNRDILGVPSNKVDIKSMPKPIKYFSYFVFTVMILGTLMLIGLFIWSRL